MKNIARHGVSKTGVNYNNKFILENKKCAKITMKKIELNYIMDNINNNNKFILENKNNINIKHDGLRNTKISCKRRKFYIYTLRQNQAHRYIQHHFLRLSISLPY